MLGTIDEHALQRRRRTCERAPSAPDGVQNVQRDEEHDCSERRILPPQEAGLEVAVKGGK